MSFAFFFLSFHCSFAVSLHSFGIGTYTYVSRSQVEVKKIKYHQNGNVSKVSTSQLMLVNVSLQVTRSKNPIDEVEII